jgi:hypothetical protein
MQIQINIPKPLSTMIQKTYYLARGASGSILGWGTTLKGGRSWVPFPISSLDFSIDLTFQLHYGPGVDSDSNRNEYQESSWGVKGYRPGSKTDNLTAVYEPTVHKMWEPRCLTTLWAFTACYRDTLSFTA